MQAILTSTIELLVAAIVVALLAHRLRLPYTVGLVMAGIAIAASPFHSGLVLTRFFIFNIILPPLIFEAAINIHWKALRQDALPILVLACFGTIIAAGVVAGGVFWVLHWPLSAALLFGALIAATDPVAVIAMFKDNHVTGRLRLLVESESLLNDGVAAILFSLALAWSQAADASALSLGALGNILAVTIGGGILAGAACGFAAMLLAWRTQDHLVEGTVTAVVAYGSFLLAAHFHGSGILATLTAGLLVGNIGILGEHERMPLTARGREFALELWDFIAFIANSIVFLLIGITVSAIHFSILGDLPLAFIILLVLVSRALSVYPLAGLFHRSRWRISLPQQHILWWGGLRGALALALALSLDASQLMRDRIVIASFAVVVFSVVVEGLTMPWLLRALHLLPRKQHP